MSITVSEITALRERIAELESQEQPLRRTGSGTTFDGNLTVTGTFAASGAVTASNGLSVAGTFSATGDIYLKGGRLALSDANDGWLRVNNSGNYSNGIYTPGSLRADGTGQFGTSGNARVGDHPSYGNGYSAIWRGSGDYALLFNANDTFLNSRGGTIYFRDNNSNRATLNSGGLTVESNISANGGYIYTASKEAIRGTDTFLRLNNAGQFSSGVYTPGAFRADGGATVRNGLSVNSGNIYVAGNLDAGFVQSRGWANFGSTGVNYWANSSNWSTGGGTIVLNALDYSSILFHDASSRVDAIIAGGGVIRLGVNIGWGAATTEVNGSLTVSGTSTFSNNNTFNGRVAINTPVWSGSALFINGFDNSPSWYGIVVRNSSSANLMYVRNDSYLWANRAWDTSSDARLKEDIEDLPTERARLKRVRYRKFKRLIDGRGDVGVVAQELREIYPELVTEVVHPTGDDNIPAGEPELAVNYQGLAVYLGKAVQELDDDLDKVQRQAKRRIDDLEAANATLQTKNSELESRLARLEALLADRL